MCGEATFLTLVPLWYLVSVAAAMNPRGIHVHFEVELAFRCEGAVGALELFILAIVMDSLHMIFQLRLGKGGELAIRALFSNFAVLFFYVLIQEIPDRG